MLLLVAKYTWKIPTHKSKRANEKHFFHLKKKLLKRKIIFKQVKLKLLQGLAKQQKQKAYQKMCSAASRRQTF